jgi:hypothetical protein
LAISFQSPGADGIGPGKFIHRFGIGPSDSPQRLATDNDIRLDAPFLSPLFAPGVQLIIPFVNGFGLSPVITLGLLWYGRLLPALNDIQQWPAVAPDLPLRHAMNGLQLVKIMGSGNGQF